MKLALCGGLWILSPVLFLLHGQEPVSVTHLELDGLKTLRHEVVVEAKLQDLWDLFTTSDGITSWIAPVAKIDFREGGLGETSYDPNAAFGAPENIVFRYHNIIPLKSYDSELVRPPKDNPFGKVLMELKNRLIFEDLGEGKVKVSILMMGWQDGAEHQSVMEFFEQGNTWYCQQLIKRCKEGPQPFPKTN